MISTLQPWYYCIIKKSIPPKAIYRFSAISIKISMIFICRSEKDILKFMWNLKGLRIDKAFLKKNKVVWLILLDFKTYYSATIIKTMWYWHRLTQSAGVEGTPLHMRSNDFWQGGQDHRVRKAQQSLEETRSVCYSTYFRMHWLTCMCSDQRLNLQSWCIRTVLWPAEPLVQGSRFLT